MSDADNERVTLDEVVVLDPLLMEMLGLVGTVVSVVVLVVLLVVVEDTKSLSFPENPHPEKYIKMGSKLINNFNLANIRIPFQIQ